MGVQKLEKTQISLDLSVRTYEQGAKQEVLKCHFNVKFLLKTRLHMKLEAQWTTPMIQVGAGAWNPEGWSTEGCILEGLSAEG